jgi:hypothetical protein
VIAHGSAAVSFETYQELLEQAQARFPWACEVVFLADRGFADTELMSSLRDLGWHFRIRINWHKVAMTDKPFGPVHLGVARPLGSEEYWYVISDEAAELKMFEEHGLRFDIEENFLDDKSNGFQLEASMIRSAAALEQLCFVLAITTLYLVSVGTSVVQQGKRRLVDPHWFRDANPITPT